MNKEEKYPIELSVNGRLEIIILNSKKDQDIVLQLIHNLENVCRGKTQSQLSQANDKIEKIKEYVENQSDEIKKEFINNFNDNKHNLLFDYEVGQYATREYSRELLSMIKKD